MGWTYLFLAGLFEVGFTYGLKLTHGGLRAVPMVITAVSALLSFGLLWLSLKSIPLGTAYAIWTGMGVIGAAIIGIVQFNEPVNLPRILCILCIAAGGIGLRMLGVQK